MLFAATGCSGEGDRGGGKSQGLCGPWQARATEIGLPAITDVDPTCNEVRVRASTKASFDDFRAAFRAKGYDLRHWGETKLVDAKTSFLAFPASAGPTVSVSVHASGPDGRREVQLAVSSTGRDGTIADDLLPELTEERFRARQEARFQRLELARRLLASPGKVPERCANLPAAAAAEAAASLLRVPANPVRPTVDASIGGLNLNALVREKSDLDKTNAGTTITAYVVPVTRGTMDPGGKTTIAFVGDLTVGVIDVPAEKLLCRTKIAPTAAPAANRPLGAGIIDADLVQAAETARGRLLGGATPALTHGALRSSWWPCAGCSARRAASVSRADSLLSTVIQDFDA